MNSDFRFTRIWMWRLCNSVMWKCVRYHSHGGMCCLHWNWGLQKEATAIYCLLAVLRREKGSRCPLDRRLNDMEKYKFLVLPGLELRNLGRPSRSQPLYLLSFRWSDYPPSVEVKNTWICTPTPNKFSWRSAYQLSIETNLLAYVV